MVTACASEAESQSRDPAIPPGLPRHIRLPRWFGGLCDHTSSCSFCRSLAGDALSLQQWPKAVQVQGQSLGAAAVLACAQLPGGRASTRGGAPSQGAASMATTIPESSSCP